MPDIFQPGEGCCQRFTNAWRLVFLSFLYVTINGCELNVETPSDAGSESDEAVSEDNAPEDNTSEEDSNTPPTLQNQRYSLSGRLVIPAGLVLDGDLNDANQSGTSNNTPDSAQPIANTAVVQGFATSVAIASVTTDSDSMSDADIARFAQQADVDDYYLVSLQAGQRIHLHIMDVGSGWSLGHGYNGDLDLFVFEATNSTQDLYASDGVSAHEYIEIQEDGNYLINVHAYRGASSYLLSLEPASQPASTPESATMTAGALSRSSGYQRDDFVPGEILISTHIESDTAAESEVQSQQRSRIHSQNYHSKDQSQQHQSRSLTAAQHKNLAELAVAQTVQQLAGASVHRSASSYGSDSSDGVTNVEYLSNGLSKVSLGLSTANPAQHTNSAAAHKTSTVISQTSDPLSRYNPHLYQKRQTLKAVKMLSEQPGVLYSEPNYYRQAFATPVDAYYHYQWHFPAIELPQAWDYATGENTLVAVIDTGVYLAHSDLQEQLVSGYDFISSSANSNDGDGIDANPDDPGDNTTIGGSSWHGTHVTGTIAARSNNSRGVSGAAWHTQVMPLRALGLFGGTSADIIQALYYAAGIDNISGQLPSQTADIINLSLGGASYSSIEAAAYQRVRDAGVIVIAAAGNDAIATPVFPASYPGVLSVSATDANQQLAPYSNYGSHIDLSAPGGNNQADANTDGQPDGVLSLSVDDLSGERRSAYSFMSGTSMAAPHVAGVVALMKSVYPQLTPDLLDAMLANGEITDDLGATGKDAQFGYGQINAMKAVSNALLRSADPSLPTPVNIQASSQTLSLSSLTPTAEFEITNTGGGEPRLVDAQINLNSDDENQDSNQANWLTLEQVAVNSQGLGSYQIRADHSQLSAGIHNGQLIFLFEEPEQGNYQLVLNLYMLVNPETSQGEISTQYLMLLTPAMETVAQTIADATGAFHFDNLSPGQYYLSAGSDIDADLILCDAGETCGQFPALGAAELITIEQQDLTDIELPLQLVTDDQHTAETLTR